MKRFWNLVKSTADQQVRKELQELLVKRMVIASEKAPEILLYE